MGKDFRGQELPAKAASALGKKRKGSFRDRVGPKHKRPKKSLPGHIYLIAVAGMAGAFLPWLGGMNSGRYGKSTLLGIDTYYGLCAIPLFFIAIMAPAMLPLRKTTLRKVVIITSLLAAIVCIAFLYKWYSIATGTRFRAHFRFGFWVELIASLALLVSAFLVKREQPEERVAYTGSAETKGLVQDPVLMGDDLDDEGWEDVSESDDDPPNSSASSDL